MVDLKGLMGAAAMILAGCAATVSPLPRDDVPAEARDAVDATEISDVTDAMEARDAVDARDAELPRMDAGPACPSSPPRPGRCPNAGLACPYANGCTYRCEGFNDSGAEAWFSTAWCF